MSSELLKKLKHEFYHGYYTKGTLLNFLEKAPLKELKEGYQYIVNCYIKNENSEKIDFIYHKIKQGYAKEQACKEFVSSMLSDWLDYKKEIKEKVLSEIPELKNYKEEEKQKESKIKIKSISS
ncbi:Uncharacterised protein [uncultured archaeon]|nr:Uncharacterised protein [uncultured archaeon]